MKITRLETFLVKPRWLFLKMHTDEGLVGSGAQAVARIISAVKAEASRAFTMFAFLERSSIAGILLRLHTQSPITSRPPSKTVGCIALTTGAN